MRRRLLVGYLALTAVTLLLLVVPLGRTFSRSESDRLFRDIEHDATVVASLSEDALEGGQRPGLDALLAAYHREPGGRIVILDLDGRSVADSTPGERLGVSFTNRPEVVRALGGGRAEGRRYSTTLGGDLVYVAVPVASGGVVHGAVRVTYPSSTLDDRVRSMWLGLGLLSAVVVLAVLLIGTVISRLVTQPVQRLEAAARRIASGDLSARAPTDARVPELRQLATVFNETADRQQQLLEAQRNFIGDASHQIRTPLAALRLQLENLESEVPLDHQASVARARAETARLGRISEDLLALTRAASATVPVGVVDVADVAIERAGVWAPIAEDGGVGLHCEVVGPILVRAAAGALEQVLDNLIDNALEVAPPGSTVEVAVARRADTVELSVRDGGPGLTAEQRERALDRFWRGPDAPPGGSGLGLAIVGELVAAGGGALRLDAVPGGGLRAVVTLVPVPDAPGTP